MKTKHTPEPWKWDESWGAIVVDRPDMQKLICPMWTGCDRARMGRDVVDEDLANANRIVACVNACKGINPEAVPDLLEACKEAKEWLVAMTLKAAFNQENKVAQDEASQIVREVSSHISAAIAKAEGGAA